MSKFKVNSIVLKEAIVEIEKLNPKPASSTNNTKYTIPTSDTGKLHISIPKNFLCKGIYQIIHIIKYDRVWLPP